MIKIIIAMLKNKKSGKILLVSFSMPERVRCTALNSNVYSRKDMDNMHVFFPDLFF